MQLAYTSGDLSWNTMQGSHNRLSYINIFLKKITYLSCKQFNYIYISKWRVITLHFANSMDCTVTKHKFAQKKVYKNSFVWNLYR
jgi:hypothetical protein